MGLWGWVLAWETMEQAKNTLRWAWRAQTRDDVSCSAYTLGRSKTAMTQVCSDFWLP